MSVHAQSRRLPALAAVLLASFAFQAPCRATNYLTQRYDSGRTGWNPGETVLNTRNVSAATFGKLWSRPVDGQVYAQPLYVADLDLPGGARSVVFAATEHNTVYAFDADAAAGSNPILWEAHLGPAVPEAVIGCGDIEGPEYGITSTPVIDRAAGVLYAVAKTLESGRQLYRLHALDLRTGAERSGWPVEIAGSVPGPGGGSKITFSPAIQHQRPGLLLLNGAVWIAFGSHCDFNLDRYHGWVFVIQTSDPTAPPRIFCSTPKPDLYLTEAGGIWQGGMGLAADPAGYVYFMTGNGPVDVDAGGRDVGDSFVRLHPDADAGGYMAIQSQRRGIDLTNQAPIPKPQWHVLAPGPDHSPALRAHMAEIADPAYRDAGADPFTGATWYPFSYLPGDAGPAGRSGTPGGIPNDTDYVLRVDTVIPADLLMQGADQVEALLLGFNLADAKLGMFINGVEVGVGSTGEPEYSIGLPAGTVRYGAVNAITIVAHHDLGPAGFTTSAPQLRITSSRSMPVPAGGLFNGNPDDLYAPSNADALEQGDTDLGSGGPIVLPDLPGAMLPRLLFGAGKDGILRLLNRDSLGGVQRGADHAAATYTLRTGDPWKLFGAPAFWNGPSGPAVFCAASGDVVRQFSLSGPSASPGITPVHAGKSVFAFPGASPAISSDGSRPGTGIVWATDHGTDSLKAYDAEDVSRLLYSTLGTPRDSPGPVRKFSVPTPVDGRVFVGTATQLAAYGLLRTPGDVDGDGAITLRDATLALQIAVGALAPSAAQSVWADLNGDGAVDLGDVVRLLRIAVGL